jgi:hypothetical protein
LREIRAHPEMEPLQAILDEAITRSQGQLLDEYDLQDFFDASARHNLRIALLVDNFDYALRNDRFWIRNDFFHHLRTLGQRVPRAVAFVVATPRSLLEYNRPGIVSSPFHNIFWNFPLGLLSERDLEAYVRQYLDNRHLQDASGTIPAVVAEASGGHPFVANFVLSLCADALEAGRDVDPDDIARQLENPDGPIVTLSHQIREILTPVERLYLNKALNGETLSPAERERLRQLASNGLLPPGVSP